MLGLQFADLLAYTLYRYLNYGEETLYAALEPLIKRPRWFKVIP